MNTVFGDRQGGEAGPRKQSQKPEWFLALGTVPWKQLLSASLVFPGREKAVSASSLISGHLIYDIFLNGDPYIQDLTKH